jgi:hypothetical protein
MIATTITASIDGIRAIPIQVEVKLQASGFPAFRIVVWPRARSRRAR